jgi:hypothetical protein
MLVSMDAETGVLVAGVWGPIMLPYRDDLIKDDFVCVAREAQEIKAKGMMETWFLEAG